MARILISGLILALFLLSCDKRTQTAQKPAKEAVPAVAKRVKKLSLPQTAEFDQYTFVLLSDSSLARVMCADKGIKIAQLNMPGPHTLIKSPDTGSTQLVGFRNGKSALMILGQPLKNHPDFPITSKRDDCYGQFQVLVMNPECEVGLSEPDAGSVHCAGMGTSEKELWVFAHNDDLVKPVR